MKKVCKLTLAMVAAMGGVPATAATIFSSDFNSYPSPNTGHNQVDTGLAENYGGSLADWTVAGANAAHAVNQGGGNWA